MICLEKILFQARGSSLCAPLNPDRGKTYTHLRTQGKIWASFYYYDCAGEFSSVVKSCSPYMAEYWHVDVKVTHNWLVFKSVPFLFPLESEFCYLWTNWGLRKCVFSWWFCPPLNFLFWKAVCSQATSVPDKATSYYYLTRKALQTLGIDKTENEKLSTCLFPVIISGFKPINISLQLSQKGTM